MSNKEFENKVLKALGNIETDVSKLKTDMSEVKKDVSELKADVSWLKKDMSEVKKDVSWLKQDVSTLKIQMVKLDAKIDEQTYDLKQTMNSNTTYLHQAFEHITRIDKERFMEKNKFSYS